MNFDFSVISDNLIWGLLVLVGIILAVVVIRFFWKHVLKYLFQGCLVIIAIIAIVAVLRYFNVF